MTPSPAIVAAGDDDETSDAVSADEDASDDDDDDGRGLLHSPRPTRGATWGAHDEKSRGGFKSEGVGCTILRSDREPPRRAKSRGAAKSAPKKGNQIQSLHRFLTLLRIALGLQGCLAV